MPRFPQRTAAAAFCAGFVFAPFVAAATPVWEQADRWVCRLELYFKVNTDSSGYAPLEAENRDIVFDFAEGTQSSVFVEQKAQIVHKHYADGAYGGYNALTMDWGAGQITNVLVDDGGEVWMTAVSGYDQGQPWFANYKCTPER